MQVYLGVDVGSVSTNVVVMNDDKEVVRSSYLRTRGRPINAIQEGLREVDDGALDMEVVGVAATGSGRTLAGAILGADLVKNEITTHAVASLNLVPDVRTVIEIGGQDSKLIILHDGVVVDFAMNTVCAAGTGCFLDHQAARLGLPIEEFGDHALQSTSPVRIAGRCSVFAESDMVQKQQLGHDLADIIAGLCEALVRNYLNNVGKGKEMLPPVMFQGGVAANQGMKEAFEKALETPVIIPPYHDVMGAVGAALLVREAVHSGSQAATSFRGFEIAGHQYRTRSFLCNGCSNGCEIANIFLDDSIVARWGGRCDRWERMGAEARDRSLSTASYE